MNLWVCKQILRLQGFPHSLPEVCLVVLWHCANESLSEMLLHQAASSRIPRVGVSCRPRVREGKGHTLQVLHTQLLLLLLRDTSRRQHDLWGGIVKKNWWTMFMSQRVPAYYTHLLDLPENQVTVSLDIHGLRVLEVTTAEVCSNL